jgi:hypothetical protein
MLADLDRVSGHLIVASFTSFLARFSRTTKKSAREPRAVDGPRRPFFWPSPPRREALSLELADFSHFLPFVGLRPQSCRASLDSLPGVACAASCKPVREVKRRSAISAFHDVVREQSAPVAWCRRVVQWVAAFKAGATDYSSGPCLMSW